MTLLLWRREAGMNYAVRELGISPDVLTATWIDYDQWMYVERGGIRIGVYRMRLQRDNDHRSYELEARSRLQIDMLNLHIPLEIDAHVQMNERFELVDCQGRMEANGQEITAQAFVKGLGLYYSLAGPEPFVPAGGIISRLDLQAPVMLADAVLPLISQNSRLRVGRKWNTHASDPISGRLSMIVHVEVEAIEPLTTPDGVEEAYRVVERVGEQSTTSWYSLDGQLLKTDLGNGLVMIRAEEKEAENYNRELRGPLRLAPIDRETIVQKATPFDPKGGNPLPWMPRL